MSLVHNLQIRQISRNSTHSFLTYLTNSQQINGNENSTHATGVRDNETVTNVADTQWGLQLVDMVRLLSWARLGFRHQWLSFASFWACRSVSTIDQFEKI